MRRIVLSLLILVLFVLPAAAFAEEEEVSLSESVVPEVKGLCLDCTRNNDITVKWKASQGADSYKVYRWNSEKKKYVRIAETKKLSYVDGNMKSVKKYTYRVAAVKDGRTGEKSAKRAIRTYPDKVKGVEVKCKAISNDIRISWKKVDGATGYKVYRWSKKKNRYVCIKTTGKLSYTDKDKASSRTYKYRVAAYKAYKGSGEKKIVKIGLKSGTKKITTFHKYSGVSLAKPLKYLDICSGYGWRYGRMHKGTDMKAPTGTRIYAPADGTVKVSHGTYNTMGITIKIQHSNGVETTYGHLSRRYVYVGDKVKQGDVIGLVGATGNASCSHLHYEVRIYGSIVNPMNFY